MAMDPSSMLYINIAIRSKSNKCQKPVQSASSCQPVYSSNIFIDPLFRTSPAMWQDSKPIKNQYQKEMKNNINKHLRLHCCQTVKDIHNKTKIQTHYNTKFNASKMT